MKILATLLLALSVPASHLAPPLRSPIDSQRPRQSANHGQWYLADTGHAIFCYGPVRVVKDSTGSLQRMATFCRGDKAMVPLKD